MGAPRAPTPERQLRRHFLLPLVAVSLLSLSLGPGAWAGSAPVCDVRDFGATGDGVTDDTAAVRAAFESCGARATRRTPATVLFVDGTYYMGAVNLTSHTAMRLSNSTLHASTDPSKYPIVPALPSYGACRDDGYPSDHKHGRHQAFISGWNLEGASVVGDGQQTSIIDGQGATWWQRHEEKTLDFGRPRLIEPMFSKDFTLTDVSLVNSPFWTVHPYATDGVYIADVNITALNDDKAYGPNTDGIDPDSATDVLVERAYIMVGDDAVAIKSGMDWFGRNFNRPTANVTFRDCHFAARHVSIGSEMSGGVYNVTFENCRFGSFGSNGRPTLPLGKYNDIGLNIKSGRGRGGLIANISAINSTYGVIPSGQAGININMNSYSDGRGPGNATTTPRVNGIYISGLKSLPSPDGSAAKLEGLEESYIENLVLENVDFEGVSDDTWSCKYVHAIEDNVSPKMDSSCLSKR